MLCVGKTDVVMGDDWRCKKARNAPMGSGAGNNGKSKRFPLDEFEKAAHIMGVNPDEFWNMCMVTFQNIRAAHFLKHGRRDDGSDPQQMRLQDLDALKESVKDKLEGLQNGG